MASGAGAATACPPWCPDGESFGGLLAVHWRSSIRIANSIANTNWRLDKIASTRWARPGALEASCPADHSSRNLFIHNIIEDNWSASRPGGYRFRWPRGVAPTRRPSQRGTGTAWTWAGCAKPPRREHRAEDLGRHCSFEDLVTASTPINKPQSKRGLVTAAMGFEPAIGVRLLRMRPFHKRKEPNSEKKSRPCSWSPVCGFSARTCGPGGRDSVLGRRQGAVQC